MWPLLRADGHVSQVKGGVVGVGGLVEGTGRELGKSFGGMLGSKKDSRASHGRGSAPSLNRLLSHQKLGSARHMPIAG